MIWTPPAAARAAAARALAVRATLPRSQRAGTPVGIARAVALRDGRPISLDTARRMLAFFTRSARFENAARPSKAWQAWNLWGGTPARDALERSPMLCLPCANPRAPVETAAAACMREIAHRSNPPRMPRTAQEARDALAAAYDDAVGRARVGAFRSDLSATRAALDDAARYSYALGFYEAAPAVPYYLLDRLRAAPDARQPDLFARSNPAPASSAYALARDFGAAAAKLPIEFFSANSLDVPSSESASFRALSSMTAGQRDSALGAGALAIELAEWVDARFNLPAPTLPDLRGHTPEAAADAVRGAWGLGERPVKNMVHLLEARGVRVFSLVEECKEVDAFSLWRGGTPYIFLNTIKSAERGRFDAGHELGHLLLHRHGAPQGREAEQEADAFASAFLMPRGSVLANAPRLPSLDHLVKLKRNWNVSVAALAHRMHALNLMSDWHYRTICIEIAQRGYKRSEPNGIPRETSQLLQKVFQALRDEGMTKPAIAKQLHVDASELDSLVFGLVMTPMQGGRTGPGTDGRRGRGQLRVV